MSNFSAGWYLIYTKPRHEKKVYTKLMEMCIDSFLPTKKTLRSWHDRRRYIDEPLFPSYVFVYLKDRQSYYDGMDTEGYLYYVRSGKDIARVNDNIITSIRLVSDHADELEVSDSHFQAGQQLVINHGSLTGLSCEVVHSDGKQKLLVRVYLLRRNILLSLPKEYLVTH